MRWEAILKTRLVPPSSLGIYMAFVIRNVSIHPEPCGSLNTLNIPPCPSWRQDGRPLWPALNPLLSLFPSGFLEMVISTLSVHSSRCCRCLEVLRALNGFITIGLLYNLYLSRWIFLGNIFANLPPSSSLMGKLELVERKSWVDRGEVPLGTSCCFVGMENFFYRPMKDYLLRFYCVSHFFLVRVCDMVIIKHFV